MNKRPWFYAPILQPILIIWGLALLLVWLFWRSISAYLDQEYHIADHLSQEPLWRIGAVVETWLYDGRDDIGKWGADIGKTLLQTYAPDSANTNNINTDNINASNINTNTLGANKANINTINAITTNAASTHASNMNTTITNLSTPVANAKITLQTGDTVFFMGDSLMQGVAPFVQKTLQKHGINSINLAKQSTGLAYPAFFDWNKTLDDTLTKHKIAVVMVFLGGNDMQDMNDHGKRLVFGTDEWSALYAKRVQGVLDSADAHGALVVWAVVPNMQKGKMAQRAPVLRDLIGKIVHDNQQIVVDTRQALGETGMQFLPSTTIDGKMVRMRAADGVHMTAKGYASVANALIDTLILPPLNP